MIPIFTGRRSTNGTLRMKSLKRDNAVALNGAPTDCRKMLVAFWIQQSTIVPR
jgi:hypothetical protein